MKYTTELKGHEGRIVKIAFNPVKEAELCSLSVDGVVKFWDVRTKKMINEVKGLGEASTLAWHPDGKNLIVGNKVRALCLPRPRGHQTFYTLLCSRFLVGFRPCIDMLLE